MNSILVQLQHDYPALTFKAGDIFSWSAKSHTITYRQDKTDKRAIWALLHEVGHALLEHHNYHSDFELVKLEAEAWQQAETVAHRYKLQIDADHIQDCLDTYRDWLHKRSTCPTCGNHSLQQSTHHYQCFNCATAWSVSSSRICRPYRRLAQTRQS